MNDTFVMMMNRSCFQSEATKWLPCWRLHIEYLSLWDWWWRWKLASPHWLVSSRSRSMRSGQQCSALHMGSQGWMDSIWRLQTQLCWSEPVIPALPGRWSQTGTQWDSPWWLKQMNVRLFLETDVHELLIAEKQTEFFTVYMFICLILEFLRACPEGRAAFHFLSISLMLLLFKCY